MRVLFCVAMTICCTSARAQRQDLAACPCGPDWIVGADRDLIPQSWHGADFRSACRHHDACLDRGHGSRRRCDRNFKKELKSACRNSSRPGECRRVASLMSRAVRSYGGRQLTPTEKNQSITRLRDINARFGRYPRQNYPSVYYASH